MGIPNTKNLGLVKAIHVGLNPPLNIKMLWYNTNPSENRHYYYDVIALMWKPLISTSTGGGTTYNFIDTNTIDFTQIGSNVSAQVKISSQVGNIIQAVTDGIFAKETATYLNGMTISGTTISLSYVGETGTNQTVNVNIASALVDVQIANAVLDPNTYILTITETDGTTHQVNFSDLIKINVQDTTTVHLSGDGSAATPLRADVKVSAAAGNSIAINNDGLYSSGGSGGGSGEFLPTPIVAKRRQPVFDELKKNIKGDIDSINPRTWLSTQVEEFFKTFEKYLESYFVQKFDVYFNSFGDRDWLKMPDKRLELLTVSNNSYKAPGAHQTSNNALSYKGNKDNFTNAITHPSNSDEKYPTVFHTIYGGGSSGNQQSILTSNLPYFVGPTEWPIDETMLNFGYNDIQPAASLNRKHNPNLVISIDVRKFLRIKGNAPMQYPVNFSQGDFMSVKNIGKILFNRIKGRVYRRNQVLFLQVSCGVPGSEVKYSGLAAPLWKTGSSYKNGQLVFLNAHIFMSTIDKNSEVPKVGGTDYWTDLGLGDIEQAAKSQYSDWNPNMVYQEGAIVTYQGIQYQRILYTGSYENPTDTKFWSVIQVKASAAAAKLPANYVGAWQTDIAYTYQQVVAYKGYYFSLNNDISSIGLQPDRDPKMWTNIGPVTTAPVGPIKGEPFTLYKERIYSGLSLPIYICPRIKAFPSSIGGKPDTWLCYGHKITIGDKSTD